MALSDASIGLRRDILSRTRSPRLPGQTPGRAKPCNKAPESDRVVEDIHESSEAVVVTSREPYLSLIAGAVFSAGAGGSAGVAPSFCACALVVAGGRFIG